MELIADFEGALSGELFKIATRCMEQITARARINSIRSAAYEGRIQVEHMDISVPPQFKNVDTALGLPAKAVDILNGRLEFEGFALTGTDGDKFGVEALSAENYLSVEVPQATTTALKYGPAFLAVTQGGKGEPQAVIRALSPTNSTVLWDKNARRAKAGLTMYEDTDDHTQHFTLFTDTHTITGYKAQYGSWRVSGQEHALGECPMALMPFQPSLEDPFGRSRISKPVLAITKRIVRSLLRAEVNAEFYAGPQRTILGLTEEDFYDPEDPNAEKPSKLQMLTSKMLLLPSTPEGQNPGVYQFPQMTMQPHLDMIRSDLALFAGETNIPVNVLGVIHENPASDAAMHTAYLALNKDAERAQATFGSGLVKAMQLAWRVANPGQSLPSEVQRMKAIWRDPAFPTQASLADAVSKLIQVGVLPPNADITYERLGYDNTTIARLLAWWQDNADQQNLNNLAQIATALSTDAKTATAVTTTAPGNAL